MEDVLQLCLCSGYLSDVNEDDRWSESASVVINNHTQIRTESVKYKVLSTQ